MIANTEWVEKWGFLFSVTQSHTASADLRLTLWLRMTLNFWPSFHQLLSVGLLAGAINAGDQALVGQTLYLKWTTSRWINKRASQCQEPLNKARKVGQVCEHMLAVPTVGRQRTHEFEASPGDTARSCFKTTKFSVLPSYDFTAQVLTTGI